MTKFIIKRTIVRKLQQFKYLNRGIVFFFDLLFSVGGTFLSYVLLIALLENAILNIAIVELLLCSGFISICLFLSTGLYKSIIRHATLREISRILLLIAVKELFMLLVAYQLRIVPEKYILICAVIDLFSTSFLMIASRAFIVNFYYTVINRGTDYVKNAFMYGTSGIGPTLTQQINNDTSLNYRVVGFLSKKNAQNGIVISGARVHAISDDETRLWHLFEKESIRYLIFSSNEDFKKERGELVEFCIRHHIKMLVNGAMKKPDKNNNIATEVKQIEVEDLLEREEILIDIDNISSQMTNKTILVTGAAGSIGREISMQLATFNLRQLILFDNSETPLHNLHLEMRAKFPNLNIVYKLGDVRSKDRIKTLFEQHKINLVFHAAAYKHVPMIEMNPCEAILANVWGTINLAHYTAHFEVEKFIMISTDKAVNPTSVMGASKRIAEMCVQALNDDGLKTQFIVTRFGNVLGSNGSVIPLFKEQIAKGGPITVTHPDIIRYFMTIPEACRLVLQAANMGKGGEIFVFDMGEQVKIVDLATRMISLSGLIPEVDIEIQFTGLRPGEKLYEELLSDNELTEASQHHKIRVAKTRSVDKEMLNEQLKRLIVASKSVNIDSTIQIMKEIVPEYISNNSKFEQFDK